MNFNSPIPRATQPRFHEGSGMRSVRDGDATSKVWQKSSSGQQQLNGLGLAVQQVQKQVMALRRRITGGGMPEDLITSLCPFKIYPSPHNPAATDSVADWRTFRVHMGTFNLILVDGTDGMTSLTNYVINPDEIDKSPPYSAGLDFVVPDTTAAFYVWIDITSPSAPVIDQGATPPTGGWTTSSGWNDGNYVLIGWIDTNSDTAIKTAHVRQIVRTDLFCIPT